MKISTDIYMITGENPNDQTGFLKRLVICLQSGISLFQFRAKNLGDIKYIYLAKKILEIAHKYNAKLILNCSIDTFDKINADGLQLTSARLYGYTSRPIDRNKILAASCHNKNDLIQAESINVDFATLSPVLKTASHPKVQPLGWNHFSKLIAATKTPVFALGGMRTKDISTAKENGAIGIAAIHGLWNNFD
ncbi:MAG: hypothetical protein ACD_46C00484G0012 [uncultured bacterium]|nr:MAG: hypothetical protein ACD_46C00484G0012 [uncultured bacterium]